MKQIQQKIQITFPINELATIISKMVIDNFADAIPVKEEKQKRTYLTRKQAYTKIGITGPTLDGMVKDSVIEKLGTGKRGRFRAEDVQDVYENLNKFLYKRKNTTYKEKPI